MAKEANKDVEETKATINKKEINTAEVKTTANASTPTPPVPPVASSPTTPTAIPRKRHSCLIIFLVVLALYIILQFIPIFGMGLFGNFADSYIPPSNINNNINSIDPSTKTNQNTNSVATKPKNTNSQTTTSKPVTETPATPADQPPAATTGPQTTFTKQEEIDYFIKIAITDESNNYVERPLHRWAKSSVSIRYFDNFTNQNDLNCANDTISILNSLSTTTQFHNDQNDGLYDIEVHFVPHSQIAAVVGDAGGYMSYILTSNSQSFSHTYAYVPIDTYPDSVRCHFIRHEITHAATGLMYNLKATQGGYHYSIFNVPVEGWTDYINIDKALIKMMYNTGIPVGSSATQARTFLEGKSW